MIVSPPCRVLVFQEMLYRCVLCHTGVSALCFGETNFYVVKKIIKCRFYSLFHLSNIACF